MTNSAGMDEARVSHLGTFTTATSNHVLGTTIAFSSLALRDFLNLNTNGLATLMVCASTADKNVENFGSRNNVTPNK